MATPGSFARFARWAADAAGRPLTFGSALLIVLIWAATGPLFHFSDTWQLVINTGTTIITFLMVFLIQNTQTRDSHAIQIKLDEIIRAIRGAHNEMLDLEDMPDEELARVHKHYVALAERARSRLERGKADTGSPDARSVTKNADRKNAER